jgi:polar amino acid transport system permease protein
VTLVGLTLSWPSFEFLAGFIGLTFYSTAFIAEELRAGISGVAKGQKYAAYALGLTGWQSMRHVVLPQALKIAMPPLLGQYMNIIKNSSLAMAIGVAELSYASRQVETETLRTFQAFGVATVLYIAIIALIEAWGMWHQQRTAIRRH